MSISPSPISLQTTMCKLMTDTTHHDTYVTGGQVLAKFKTVRSKTAGGRGQ